MEMDSTEGGRKRIGDGGISTLERVKRTAINRKLRRWGCLCYNTWKEVNPGRAVVCADTYNGDILSMSDGVLGAMELKFIKLYLYIVMKSHYSH